jgi:hypothetical protein
VITARGKAGDSWRHEVVVESIDLVPLMLKFAICLDGQLACPPEDCGGTRGYEEFLEAIANPEHEQHDDFLGWLGALITSTKVTPSSSVSSISHSSSGTP